MFDVSVIIPSYNDALLIRGAIDSVLNQTVPPAEILVVDDGSTDNTAEIVETYAESGVKYLYKENGGGGPASPRNYGIKRAVGRFIALLDADDQWKPCFIENIQKAVQKRPDTRWLITRYERRLENGDFDYSREPSPQFVKDGVIIDYFQCEASDHVSLPDVMVIEREIYETVGFFDETIGKYGEDLDMWFRVALLDPSPAWIDELGATYWHRTGSITSASVVDLKRFVTRIQKTESHALYRGLDALERAEPMIMDWVVRALKLSVKNRDRHALKHIYRRYGTRLPFKFQLLLVAALLVRF